MQGNQESSQQQGPLLTIAELKIVPIFSLSLSYDIYRVTVGEASYIAKVFPPNKVTYHEKEISILTQLNHPRIIKPIDFSHALVSKLASSVINAFILFPECSKGDLLTYVLANGSLSEKVARFYTQQIVEALSYAQERSILHPRLLAENILIDEGRNTLICGWSNSINHQNQTIKNLLFSTGELIINLVTSRMPFISKQSKNDTFAKFLNEKYIDKLWGQLQKAANKFNKNFQFSKQLKQLLEGLLLGKIDSLKDILNSNWMKEPANSIEVYDELKNQENRALESKQLKKKKAIIAQNQQKELIKNNFSLNLNRKPSRSTDIFQDEYENFQNQFINIEQKSKSDSQLYFQLFDTDIRFVISHLRARLKQVELEDATFIDELLLLKNYDVTINGSVIKVSFTFGWNFGMLGESSLLSGFNHSIEVVICRENNQLFGRLELNEALELNTSCVYQLNNWLIETLQHHG